MSSIDGSIDLKQTINAIRVIRSYPLLAAALGSLVVHTFGDHLLNAGWCDAMLERLMV